MPYPSRPTLTVLPQFRGTARVRQTPEQRAALLAFVDEHYRAGQSLRQLAEATGRSQGHQARSGPSRDTAARARRPRPRTHPTMRRPVGRRRTVRDWTPDLGDGEQWLAQLKAEGWTPEYGAGVRVKINGRHVVRYALIETDEPPAKASDSSERSERSALLASGAHHVENWRSITVA